MQRACGKEAREEQDIVRAPRADKEAKIIVGPNLILIKEIE